MQQFADHTIPYDYLQYNIENILNVQIEGTPPPDNVKIRNSMAAIHLKKMLWHGRVYLRVSKAVLL